MLPTADAGGCSGVRDGILVRLHENRAEFVEVLDFGGGRGRDCRCGRRRLISRAC